MKPRYQRDLSTDEVERALPPAYRGKLKLSALPEGRYTLVLFSSDRVIHSRPVTKALETLAEKENAIFAGSNFTVEALKAIKERGHRVVSTSDFHWSDESHENIKVIVGASVKKP